MAAAQDSSNGYDSTSSESCHGVDEIHSQDNSFSGRGGSREDSRTQRNYSLSVRYQDTTVHLQVSSGTLFHEFDYWVRSRYSLPPETYQVAYLDSRNQEFLPQFDSLEEDMIINVQARRISSKSYSGYFKKSSPSLQHHWTKYLSFSYIFPVLSLLYLIIFLSPTSPIPNPMNYFTIFSPIFTFLGISSDSQLQLYREIVTTFIAWPVPYFFIRRSLNPDFGIYLSFQKFGSDSFWGAVAACALVVLRHFVKSHLSDVP